MAILATQEGHSSKPAQAKSYRNPISKKKKKTKKKPENSAGRVAQVSA
jgi:hypothetical protein